MTTYYPHHPSGVKNGITFPTIPKKSNLGVSLFTVWYRQLVSDLSPIAYWPLWELAGTIAYDLSGNGRNGAYNSVNLGQPGIGDGGTCPLFNGNTSHMNAYSLDLMTAFSGLEGTIVVPARVLNVGVWTDGINRYLASFRVDVNNRIYICKTASGNVINVIYTASGVTQIISIRTIDTIAFFWIGLTWSRTADEVRVYLNGLQQGTTQTGLANWIGIPLLNWFVFGNATTADTQGWLGWIAQPAMWNVALTPTEMAYLKSPNSGGGIAFVFDDGHQSVYTTAFAYMQPRGITATVYAISDLIGTVGCMTGAQFQDVNAAGWDVANHTKTHLILTGRSQAAVEAELTACQMALEALGLTRASHHVGYPNGLYDAVVLTAMAATGMLTGRTGNIQANVYNPPPSIFELGSRYVTNATLLTTVQGWITTAVAEGCIVFVGFHIIGGPTDISVANFQTLMDWVATNGFQTYTISQLYDLWT